MAYTTEMVDYQTETGLTASNTHEMNELYKNNTNQKDKNPLTYYIHEVGENGESRLYEYTYDNVDALMEQKARENEVKQQMKSVEGKN